MTEKTVQKKLTQQQAIVVERDLAKFANTMIVWFGFHLPNKGLGLMPHLVPCLWLAIWLDLH
jgi:hypothetical protein